MKNIIILEKAIKILEHIYASKSICKKIGIFVKCWGVVFKNKFSK